MKVAISGASGFIGRHLSSFFTKQNWEVIPLGREILREEAIESLTNILDGCDVIINLAGAPLNRRWSKNYKQELLLSRLDVTDLIIQALFKTMKKPGVFISASATGYYPSDGEFDESYTGCANGFAALLCRKWESQARRCPEQTRLVITRFGLVLSQDGGVLQKMLRPLRCTKFSPVIATGKQPFPWISMTDLCRAMAFLIEHKELYGVFNLVSPQIITQKHFAEELGRRYHAWGTVHIPAFVFKLLYGKSASVLLSGQRVHPCRLLEAGFQFTYPSVTKLLGITDKTSVKEVDLVRYMGHWYEIARYENRFEKGITYATATYTLLSGGMVRVENKGERNGKKRVAIGLAKCPDMLQPGRLKVSFFLWFYSPYYIFELDPEYQYALIGSRSDRYLWILARTPQLPEQTMQKLLAIIEERGYDSQKLLIFNAQK